MPLSPASKITAVLENQLVNFEGIRELVKAFQYSDCLDTSVWQFAIEYDSLLAMGLTQTDLRWLVASNLVELREEIFGHDSSVRRFVDVGTNLRGPNRCFVLSRDGADLLSKATNPTFKSCNSDSSETPVPNWDESRNELWCNSRLVKRFRLPSPNQIKVIEAFQEEDWPSRVYDPLPQSECIHPKQRLHDTIRSLNRHQKNRIIQFCGDGSGEGVMWQAIDPNSNKRDDSAACESVLARK